MVRDRPFQQLPDELRKFADTGYIYIYIGAPGWSGVPLSVQALPGELLSFQQLVDLRRSFMFKTGKRMAVVNADEAGGDTAEYVNVKDVHDMPPNTRVQRIVDGDTMRWRAWPALPAPGFLLSHQETGPGALERLRDWLWRQHAAALRAPAGSGTSGPDA